MLGLGWLRRKRLRLNRPTKINGDVCIRFRGKGRARFRLQHAGGNDEPEEILWCDVSAMSDRRVKPEEMVKDHFVRRGVLVDVIEGETAIQYRRHAANWLRVVPLDETEEQQCKRYSVTLEPVS